MLLRSFAPGLLAIAGVANAQLSFSDLASCGQQCINNMDTTIGCVPVTSECLCSNSNFLYGIHDCADSACTSAADATAAYDYASSSCASVLAATSTTEPQATSVAETSEAAATTEPAPTSSFVATDSAAPISSETSPVEAAQTTSLESSSPAAATTDASTTQTAASGMTTIFGSATKTGSTAATSGAAAAAASSSSSASGTSSDSSSDVTNLSTGAKAGIVVGSACAAVALVGIVLFLSRKRSPPLPRGNMKISEPLPGSGRIGDEAWEQYHTTNPPFSPQYPRPPGTAGSNMSELDRNARPYEEMVPRTKPARIV